MKKILVLVLLPLACIAVFAQNKVNFMITAPDGKYVIEGSDKNYYVFYYEGQTKEQLYTKTLVGVTKTFVSAKDVVTKVENSMISINSIKVDSYILGGLVPIKRTISYNLEFEFKDGKIKVNTPELVYVKDKDGNIGRISDFICSNRNRNELGTGWERWLFVNDVINNILANINKEDSEDW